MKSGSGRFLITMCALALAGGAIALSACQPPSARGTVSIKRRPIKLATKPVAPVLPGAQIEVNPVTAPPVASASAAPVTIPIQGGTLVLQPPVSAPVAGGGVAAGGGGGVSGGTGGGSLAGGGAAPGGGSSSPGGAGAPPVNGGGVLGVATLQVVPDFPDPAVFGRPLIIYNNLRAGDATIRGVVYDMTSGVQVPLGDAWLTIVSASDHTLRADFKSGAGGQFQLVNIAAGNYFGLAQKQGFQNDSLPRFIAAAGMGIAGVDFVLTR